MWIEITPRRPDFCGRPPCQICYRWGEDNGVSMSGLERMSLELTGKFLDELTKTEKIELQKAADRIHSGALLVPPPMTEEPPQADLGMSDAAHLDGWLAQHKAPAVPLKPVQLSLDQRNDWQAPTQKAVEQEAQKVKEIEKAKELATVGPGPDYARYAKYVQMDKQFFGASPSSLIIDDPIAKIMMREMIPPAPMTYFWDTAIKRK